jgi:hypothetical protein
MADNLEKLNLALFRAKAAYDLAKEAYDLAVQGGGGGGQDPTLFITENSDIFYLSDYGVVGDGVTDNYAKIQECLADMEAYAPGGLDCRAPKLIVPYGIFFCSNTIEIERSIIIEGIGGWMLGQSRFKFPLGKTGFIIKQTPSNSIKSEGTVIRDIGIYGSWTNTILQNFRTPEVNIHDPLSSEGIAHSQFLGHGVLVHGRVRMENCHIYGFEYDGIYLDSRVNGMNQNGSVFDNLRIFGCGRHGISIPGGINSQVIRFASVDVANCAGWGVYDRSFLGNHYDTCQVAECGHFAADCSALAVDPTNSDIVWAGFADTGAAFWSKKIQSNRFPPVTYEAGTYWQMQDFGTTTDGNNRVLRGFAFATGNATIGQPGYSYRYTYAAFDGMGVGVFNSFEKTWALFGTAAGLTDLNVKSIAGKTGSGTMYAATPSGVFKSTNWGQTWAITGHTISTTAVALDKDGNPLAGTSTGLYRSTDAGTNWTQIDTSSAVSGNAIAVRTDDIIVGTSSGIRYSTNNGTSFAGGLTGAVNAVAIGGDGDWYAGQSSGVQKSTNQGGAWTLQTTGLTWGQFNNVPVTDVRAIAADQRADRNDWVYVGVHPTEASNLGNQTGGVFKSINGGTQYYGGGSTNVLSARNTFYGGGFKVFGELSPCVLTDCYMESDEIAGMEVDYPSIIIGGISGYNSVHPMCNGGVIDMTTGMRNIPIISPTALPYLNVVRSSPLVLSSSSFENFFVPSGDYQTLWVNATNGNLTIFLADPVTETDAAGRVYHIIRVEPSGTSPVYGVRVQVSNGRNIQDGTQLQLPSLRSTATLMATASGYVVLSRDASTYLL